MIDPQFADAIAYGLGIAEQADLHTRQTLLVPLHGNRITQTVKPIGKHDGLANLDRVSDIIYRRGIVNYT